MTPHSAETYCRTMLMQFRLGAAPVGINLSQSRSRTDNFYRDSIMWHLPTSGDQK